MSKTEKYDRLLVGVISGFILPLLAGLVFYFFSKGNRNIAEYFQKIVKADIVTHMISLAVFPNLFIFLIFNRLDMLNATRGVLGVTIFWAALVFAVKFLV